MWGAAGVFSRRARGAPSRLRAQRETAFRRSAEKPSTRASRAGRSPPGSGPPRAGRTGAPAPAAPGPAARAAAGRRRDPTGRGEPGRAGLQPAWAPGAARSSAAPIEVQVSADDAMERVPSTSRSRRRPPARNTRGPDQKADHPGSTPPQCNPRLDAASTVRLPPRRPPRNRSVGPPDSAPCSGAPPACSRRRPRPVRRRRPERRGLCRFALRLPPS